MTRDKLERTKSAVAMLTLVILTQRGGLLPAQEPVANRSEPTDVSSQPVGDKYVESIQLLKIPGATSGGVQAAIAFDQYIYLAGKSWKQHENKERLWLWRIDASGKVLWEKPLAHQTTTEEVRIVGLLGGARVHENGPINAGVRVVFRQGGETRLSYFNGGGKLSLEKIVGALEETQSLVPLNDKDTLLLGHGMSVQNQPSHAWVARMTRTGSVTWKHTFAPQAAHVPADDQLRPKGLPLSLLLDGVRLNDDSLALVGQTGIYNKFAQGPSKLWLLRLDDDGNKLDETFVDGGRMLSSGRQLIAASGDGVIVPYTTDQLPPINAVPINVHPEFGTNWARYDAALKQLWNKPFATTGMPGAATIVGPAPFVSLIAMSNAVLILGSDDAGKELWRSQVTTPNAFVTPLAALRTADDGIIAVCNYRAHGRAAGQQVLLFRVKPPRGGPRS